jgi:hypothetical protein
VATGILDGLDADQLAHAMAIALAAPGRATAHTRHAGGQARALLHASAAVQGQEAVAMAKAGMQGPLGILDSKDGLLADLCWIPLRNAFTGMGKAWLSDTLSYKRSPVSLPVQVAVQSVAEILARHMKAAGRRLRPDQVERIEIRTSLPGVFLEEQAAQHTILDPSTVSGSARRSIATLLVGHGLGREQFTQDWLNAEQERIMDLASRVELIHCWDCSMRQLTQLVESATPLFAGLTAREIKSVLRCAGGNSALTRPKGFDSQWRVLKARPDRLLDKIRYASGDLGDVDWADWQLCFPTQVRLFTTRGGSWPEKRTIPEGSPGWPWEKTVDGVVERFAGEDTTLAERARMLLCSDLEGSAEEWVGGLLH